MLVQESRTAKRRKLNTDDDITGSSVPEDAHSDLIKIDADFAKRASAWNLEQTYEKKGRNKSQTESLRLPIKTLEGKVQNVSLIANDPYSSSADSEDHAATQVQTRESVPDTTYGDGISKTATRQDIIQAKEELARVAASINEAPEDKVSSLKSLAEIAASPHPTIAKLALATQRAVYENIIPGYRIRPIKEEESNARVTKEVKTLRNFEQALVKSYQRYVQDLSRKAGRGREAEIKDDGGLASVAIACACGLLASVPHFNFRTDLLKIVIGNLTGKRHGPDFRVCIGCLREMFSNDDDGHASLEAVSMIARAVKAKPGRISGEVLDLFLNLRLLSEFSGKASNKNVEQDETTNSGNPTQQKRKREFRTKKERKIMRERKVIEKEMREADAVVSNEERQQTQADVLKQVFGIYIRVLKTKEQSLVGTVLEGLARYARLINQEFFGDIIEALKEIIENQTRQKAEDAEVMSETDQAQTMYDASRESLLCVITAFSLLHGQDGNYAKSALHLDLEFFVSHLYSSLMPMGMNSGIEREGGAEGTLIANTNTDAAEGRAKINKTTTSVLLLRALSVALIPEYRPASAPAVRIAAFVKQLMTLALHVPDKSATALMRFVEQTVKIHRRTVSGIWNTEDRRGDGVFDPTSDRIERANPLAATVWEGELLQLHYSPKVRAGSKQIEKLIVSG